jgi:hypothetical protein
LAADGIADWAADVLLVGMCYLVGNLAADVLLVGELVQLILILTIKSSVVSQRISKKKMLKPIIIKLGIF